MTTFTGTMLSDLYYELNDQDIANDVLLIDGAPGSEKLIRGVSTDSIARYGRRSKRIERPLATDQATGESLVEDQLDRYSFEAVNPLCRLKCTIPAITDALLIAIFGLNVSDKVTIQVAVMGLNEEFWVDDIELELSSELTTARLGLVEVA